MEIHLKADGVPANLLPTLTPPQLKGVRIYAEPSQSHQIRTTEGIQSRRTFRWTLLFQAPGVYTWPQQLLAWWNTRTRQVEWVKLRERTFSVQPASASSSLSPVKPDPVSPISEPTSSPVYWQLATAMLALLHLLWLFLWLRRKRTQTAHDARPDSTASSSNQQKPPVEPCKDTPLQLYQYLLTLPPHHPWRTHPAYEELETALFHQQDDQAARAAQRVLCQASMQKKETFPSKKSSTRLKSLYS